MSDDITFCGSDCNNKKCFRHPNNIQEPRIPHSFAYLKGTEYCPMKKQEVRLIDANALKEEYVKLGHCADTYEELYISTEKLIDNAPTVEISPQDKALNEIIKYLKDDTVTWRDISDDIIIQILEDNGLW